MRVITGKARGRKLKDFEGRDIRPTTDMVKEAIFSIIQFDIEGSEVLDLFSGTGQLGIEALSRGAKFCRFVDKSKESAELTNENINLAGFRWESNVVNGDSLDFLRMARYTFDIALLDPPYNNGLIEQALPLLEPKMSQRGIAVCEHERGLELPDEVGRLKKSKTYNYGKVAVTVYRIPFNEEE
ncbi:MAG: 16S rRNA (guanine(966)-N(2))-methyltransferase RsmD [Oscillospiraceae bacterium]